MEWYHKKRADPEWDARRKRRNRENARKRRANNPEKQRDNELRKRYGISYEHYRSMREAQAGLCAICRFPLAGGRKEHLDHSHTTGEVRGILCRHCNHALGHVRESVDTLRGMIAYLEERG